MARAICHNRENTGARKTIGTLIVPKMSGLFARFICCVPAHQGVDFFNLKLNNLCMDWLSDNIFSVRGIVAEKQERSLYAVAD